MQIVEQIIELINSGEFPPGSQLPPERELASRLNVSRAPVREALSALQILGLVETRPGQGTVVLAKTSPLLQHNATWLYDEESPFTILQARKAVEPEVARLAALNRTPEQLQRIAEIRHVVDEDLRDPRVFSQGDRRFHLAIAEASGNSVLLRMITIIHELMGQELWLALMQESTFNTPGRLQGASREHEAIQAAIRDGNADEAARLMRAHLESVERWMMEADLTPVRKLSQAS